jgi:hypothetical protein
MAAERVQVEKALDHHEVAPSVERSSENVREPVRREVRARWLDERVPARVDDKIVTEITQAGRQQARRGRRPKRTA